MKCPNCYFDNKKNKNVCENCGSDLHPAAPLWAATTDQSLTPGAAWTPRTGRRPRGNFFKAIGHIFMAIFNFTLYIAVIVLCAAAILGVLVWQCRINVPIAPGWSFMPKVAANYWNWLDGWQMERCPDLPVDNYFFGNEPVPAFDTEGELVFQPECGDAAITFTPPSAPAGSTFSISMDNFSPDETVSACWYFPSTKLENCADLGMDGKGHRDTAYFSDANYPKGTYLMEVESACGTVSQEFNIE